MDGMDRVAPVACCQSGLHCRDHGGEPLRVKDSSPFAARRNAGPMGPHIEPITLGAAALSGTDFDTV